MTSVRSATPERPDEATWRSWDIDPTWSRLLDVPSHDGAVHRWHLLDTGPGDPGTPTILCVHGNPTWSYAWTSFLGRFGERHRVVAIDQLGMGYSDRVDPRRYVDRVADLGDLIRHADLQPGPAASGLVLAAHDWGGAIAMGWAVDHAADVAAMVLCNTGIAVPEGRSAPKIIRLAASGPLRDLVCRRTSTFVEGTVRLSGRRITRRDRIAFRAPYRHAANRTAIADFVGDVPLSDDHPSASALAEVASKLPVIDAPVLLAWGARDIVFDDDFAQDLMRRLPNARLERFPRANHLVMAEADVASTVDAFLHDLDRQEPDDDREPEASRETSVFDGLCRRAHDDTVAVSDLAARETIDFATFARRVDAVAAGLVRRGVAPGDRVAMLTPPGIDLLIAVYGVWRAGGVTVVADRGLGLRGLGRAIASARPAWTIGPRRAAVASRAMRWAPRSCHIDLATLVADRAPHAGTPLLPPAPTPDMPGAILFTSGATGPAKGVHYLHGQLAAQRDALAATYGITDDDRLVAAFAPFALYGPALGVPTALTDCDVTTPGSLTASALGEACTVLGATMAFASPSALANVVATVDDADETDRAGIAGLRLVFSAGAPVPAETLHAIESLAPDASIRTPYGMTEALPVADIDLDEIDRAERVGDGRGVCVGHPVSGAEVRIVPLGFDALGGVPDACDTGETGEILVRASWVSDGYLARWHTQRLARPGLGWHRSGDVGHLDETGRLWVEGRSVHVIDASDRVVTPVPVERAVERALSPEGLVTTGRVAAVGVGPGGCQQVVVVVERVEGREGLADRVLAAAVRDAVDVPVAAVLAMREMPVDIRHNAKIDRTAVAAWASAMLS